MVVSLPRPNPWTVAVGACALAVIFLLGAWAPRIPWASVVLVLRILAVRYFGLHEHLVEIVGRISIGLLGVRLPVVSRGDLIELFTGAIRLVLIVYAEALAASRPPSRRGSGWLSAYRRNTPSWPPTREISELGSASRTVSKTHGSDESDARR